MNGLVVKVLATSVYSLVALLSWAFLILIALFVVIKLYKLMFGQRSVSGVDSNNDRTIHLVGLGVALLIFPTVLPALLLALISIMETLLIQAPSRFFSAWGTSFAGCDEGTAIELCIGAFSSQFTQSWSSIFGDIKVQILSLSAIDIVLFFVVWAIVAKTTRLLATSEADESKIYSWYQENGKLVKNMTFFFILAVGIYLSLAAIAAIPILQQQTASFEEVSDENLKLALERELNQFIGKFPNEIGDNNSLAEVKRLLPSNIQEEAVEEATSADPEEHMASASDTVFNQNIEIADNAITGTVPISGTTDLEANVSVALTAEQIENLEQVIGTIEETQQNNFRQWQIMLNVATVQLSNAKDASITTYTVSKLARKGNFENFDHFLQIHNWYSEEVSRVEILLALCRSEIQTYDQDVKSWSQRATALQNNDDVQSFLINKPSVNNTGQSCRSDTVEVNKESIPDRPALGSSILGPFSPVVSWLVQTESMPLTLIVGMLGFGLFGSAAATFVRQKKARNKPDEPLVEDLTGVVLRGVSAAFVVFLAVLGGLAVYASGTSQPNPYVVLLTCLIAAVYSGDVWKWAKQVLAKNLPDVDTPQGQIEGPQPGDPEEPENG